MRMVWGLVIFLLGFFAIVFPIVFVIENPDLFAFRRKRFSGDAKRLSSDDGMRIPSAHIGGDLAGDEIKCDNSECGAMIDADGVYYIGYDHQKNYKEMHFCSAECLRSWIKKKYITMIVVLVLGLVLMILGFTTEISAAAPFLVFVPYVIRQIGSKLGSLFDSGVIGEILSMAIFIIACSTFVYPIYKICKESSYYARTLKALESEI